MTCDEQRERLGHEGCFCREEAPRLSDHWGTLLGDPRGWEASATQGGAGV